MALWREDFSEVGAWLAELRAAGVTDISDYPEAHPADARRTLGLIRIIDANDAAVEMLEAESKEHLLAGVPQGSFTAETRSRSG